MLESFVLNNLPESGSVIKTDGGPLSIVNYVYGANASGKTTISRALSGITPESEHVLHWQSADRQLDIRVYNHEYTESVLAESTRLRGVFLLGENSKNNQIRIDEIADIQKQFVQEKIRLDERIDEINNKINEKTDSARQNVWDKKKELPDSISVAFDGFHGSKDKVLEEATRVFKKGLISNDDLDSIELEASSVFDKNTEEIRPISEIPSGTPCDFDGYYLMSSVIVGAKDVNLSGLIDKLGNHDWVHGGLPYVLGADGVCPFCQQSLPLEFSDQINAYFDDEYSTKIRRVESLRHELGVLYDQWEEYFQTVERRNIGLPHLDMNEFKNARDCLRSALQLMISAADDKISAPSTVFKLGRLDVETNVIEGLVNKANASIRRFNKNVQNRNMLKRALVDRCWSYFVWSVVADDLRSYIDKVDDLKVSRDDLQRRQREIEADIAALDDERYSIEAENRSEKHVMNSINGLLESVGFTSFFLATSDEIENGYRIVRRNGECSSATLSEGEKTFISFLYFFYSLHDASSKDHQRKGILAVIDDPVSSLDSDIAHAVAGLILDIVSEAKNENGSIRQTIVLTHNAYFFRNLDKQTQCKKKQRSYGVVSRPSPGTRVVEISEQAPIVSSYSKLWSDVRRAESGSSISAVTVQNLIRRILETYFDLLGGVKIKSLESYFDGEERHLFKGFVGWINAGSHAVFDDVEYVLSASEVKMYLHVFKRVFEVSGHQAHYDMMMSSRTYAA